MLFDMRQILLVIHILLGIIWVGGVLFVGWGVYPTVRKMNIPNQRAFLISLMNWTHKLFTLVGLAVIFTGILLGTVFGPIKEWHYLLTTTYGHIFLTALIIGFATLGWGSLVAHRYTMKVLGDQSIWNYAEKGSTTLLNHEMFKVTLVTSVEVIGFTALIYLIVLL